MEFLIYGFLIFTSSQSKCITIDGVSDKSDFSTMRRAMLHLKFTSEEVSFSHVKSMRGAFSCLLTSSGVDVRGGKLSMENDGGGGNEESGGGR
jgi:hypothetical protein